MIGNVRSPDGARPRASAAIVSALDRLGVSPRSALLWLYLLALAINLAFGLAIKFRPTPAGLEADELEYYGLAGAILHGTLAWDARRTLGFPLILAGIRELSDTMLFLQLAITAIFSTAPALLYLLVRKLSRSPAAAMLAGLMLACWPPGIFFGTSLYSEAVALPLFLATLLALPAGSRTAAVGDRRSWAGALLCGMLLGLTTHVRPMYLLFTPVLVLIVLIEEAGIAAAGRRLLLVAVGFVMLILPWSAVMTAHFGHPILVTANGGETLAGGLNPTLTGDGGAETTHVTGREVWAGPGKWIAIGRTGYLSPAELALPYDRKDALLQARTRAWILGHPGPALRIEALKLAYMWGLYPLGRDGIGQLVFGNLPTVALLLAALATLIAWPAARVQLPRLWMLPLFVSGVALISWGSWRFRQPADAGLLALLAIAIVHLVTRRAAEPARRSAEAQPPISSAR